MSIEMENGVEREGTFTDERIEPTTVPEGKSVYELRGSDEDFGIPATIKNGNVNVNFCGSFICDTIQDFEHGAEMDLEDWGFFEEDEED